MTTKMGIVQITMSVIAKLYAQIVMQKKVEEHRWGEIRNGMSMCQEITIVKLSIQNLTTKFYLKDVKYASSAA